MYKTTITALAFLLGTSVMTAQEQAADSTATPSDDEVVTAPLQQKFGYLSYSKVMHSMPEYIQAQKSLGNLRNTYASELKRSEDAFNRQFEEYIDGQKSFPENILLKRQQELQQLMQQSVEFKQEAQRLISKAEAEMMEPIKAKLDDAIVRFGLAKGYAYILNTDANSYPFINPQLGTDITSDILSAINP